MENTMIGTTAPSGQASVIYDGDCAFCCKSIAILRRLDWFGRLEYINFRDPAQPLLKEPILAGAPLVDEMHLVTPSGSHVYHGFGALRWLAWRVPLLWIVAPFLYIPGVPLLGQKMYLWVARNRFRLIPCHDGACTIQRKGNNS